MVQVEQRAFYIIEVIDVSVIYVFKQVAEKRGVSSPIVGASKVAQLDDAIAALAFQLSDEEKARLEAPYVPHAVTGFK
jgi:aryl-alcohol dehydrogenase-like predicted oxidoreductase